MFDKAFYFKKVWEVLNIKHKKQSLFLLLLILLGAIAEIFSIGIIIPIFSIFIENSNSSYSFLRFQFWTIFTKTTTPCQAKAKAHRIFTHA